MTKWEYQIAIVRDDPLEGGAESWLDQQGREGWELVSWVALTVGRRGRAILKRPRGDDRE